MVAFIDKPSSAMTNVYPPFSIQVPVYDIPSSDIVPFITPELSSISARGSFIPVGTTCDVMPVFGTEDILTPQEISLQIAGHINGSWIVWFKGLPYTGYDKFPSSVDKMH